jgi:hypothetical protein
MKSASNALSTTQGNAPTNEPVQARRGRRKPMPKRNP